MCTTRKAFGMSPRLLSFPCSLLRPYLNGIIIRTRSGMFSLHQFRVLRCTRFRSYSSAPKLHKFVLFAPDATDSPRFSVMKQHRSEMAPSVTSGIVKVAGMMVKSTPEDPYGSLIIYEAENIDAVRKMVESDIYYTSGVWEKLVLLPFLPATFPSQ
ncbi:hypothetical protein D9757_005654 [Collybiopsis confluens]|uniref:YCII-related domain-containing protein n=1 Tax=Collybiopsis confluens TaxID=2823264 RepID=A0A8H5HTA4_9AGAR|nr:hypothetical protein D9757_005654 [Collybiopsis confluens]